MKKYCMLSVVRTTASNGSLSEFVSGAVVTVYSKVCPPACGRILSGLSSGGTISTTPVGSTSSFKSRTRS